MLSSSKDLQRFHRRQQIKALLNAKVFWTLSSKKCVSYQSVLMKVLKLCIWVIQNSVWRSQEKHELWPLKSWILCSYHGSRRKMRKKPRKTLSSCERWHGFNKSTQCETSYLSKGDTLHIYHVKNLQRHAFFSRRSPAQSTWYVTNKPSASIVFCVQTDDTMNFYGAEHHVSTGPIISVMACYISHDFIIA